MIETLRSDDSPTGAQPPDALEETTTLRDVWTTLARHRRLVPAVLLGTLALAVLLTLLQRPVYEASSLLRVHTQQNGLSLMPALPTAAGGGDGLIETEIAVLRSRRIAEAVVDSLALHVRLEQPELPRHEVLRVVASTRDVVPSTWEFERTADDAWRARRAEAEDDAPPAPQPFAVGAGTPFTIGGVTLELVPSRADRIRIEIVDFDEAVRELRDAMPVSRPDRLAQVIEITYRDHDPVLTAQVVNEAARSFIAYKSVASRFESGSTVEFLRGQVADYDAQLRMAESELRAFRERERVVSPEEEATEQVRRLAQLRAQRDELRYERDALAALLARIGSETASDTATGTSPYRQLASFPVFLGNRAVQDLLQSITTLENQRAELMVRRTESSVDVQGINRRIAELERQLYQTARSYLGSLDSQLASVDESLERFGAQLAQVPAREVQYARLLRQQELLSEMYVMLETRLKEAEIQNAAEPADVRVIDPAIEPDEPVAPKPFRNLLIATVLGAMLAVAAAYMREAMDTKVRTVEDAQQATGHAVLAMIPRIAGAEAGNGRASRLPFRRALRLEPEHANGTRLVARNDPRSPVAEAYRSLRTGLAFASTAGMPRSVVVTSATPGEGKSTSAANLAVTLAQQGSRVLLVDADLRRGLLHEVFVVAQDPGLSHVLLGRKNAEEAAVRVPLENASGELWFMPSGVYPPNPAELIGSPRMRELLNELRARYDVVLLDAPPLNLVTDAGLLGTGADATLLITRSGTTEKKALQHAVAQLRRLRASIGGVVLNDFDDEQRSYYGAEGRFYGAPDDARRA